MTITNNIVSYMTCKFFDISYFTREEVDFFANMLRTGCGFKVKVIEYKFNGYVTKYRVDVFNLQKEDLQRVEDNYNAFVQYGI